MHLFITIATKIRFIKESACGKTIYEFVNYG